MSMATSLPESSETLSRRWSFSPLNFLALKTDSCCWSTGSSVSTMCGSHRAKLLWGSFLMKSTISAGAPDRGSPLPAAPARQISSSARKDACSICRQTALSCCEAPWHAPPRAAREWRSPYTWSVSWTSWGASSPGSPLGAWSPWASLNTRPTDSTDTASRPRTSRRPTLPPPVITKTSGCLRKNSAGLQSMIAVTGCLKRARKRPHKEDMYTESTPSAKIKRRNSSTMCCSVMTAGTAGNSGILAAFATRCPLDDDLPVNFCTSGRSSNRFKVTFPAPRMRNVSVCRLKRSSGRVLMTDVTEIPFLWMNFPQSADM
mmetsp:Transcript_58640/g.165496  ORF Transcript_58640/g.165496 Transcript_58640/m.165496 type:complete len:317 (+) Transcript_58640:530-1480(+)